MNFGECYYDHYLRFFGEPQDRTIFGRTRERPFVDLFLFSDVIEGCRIFCTLGLSLYFSNLLGFREIMLVLDTGWAEAPSIVVELLSFMVENNVPLARGTHFDGVENISAAFADKYQKSAIYFTLPPNVPDDFSIVECNNQVGIILLAFFISQSEFEFIKQNGFEQFEDILEQKEIDVYNLSRDSCI